MEFKSYEVSIGTPLGRTINIVVAAENEHDAMSAAKELLIDFIDTAPETSRPHDMASNFEAVHLVGGRIGSNLYDADAANESAYDAYIAERERGLDQILDYREETGL